MQKLRILLLFIISIAVFSACDKTKNNDDGLQILGVNVEDIEKIEMIHGNIILYPDLTQEQYLASLGDLNIAFENTGDKIGTLDGHLPIALIDAEAYAQNDNENYYVYITFLKPQTLSFNNSNEEQQDCDGILFDVNNLKLNWSKNGKFVGVMGYINSTTSVEKEFATYRDEIKRELNDLGE